MFELRQTRYPENGFSVSRTVGPERSSRNGFRIKAGLPGDTKSPADGIGESRIRHGPGYRIYYARRGTTLILLLCGGGKGSQARDILRARRLAKEIGYEDHEI